MSTVADRVKRGRPEGGRTHSLDAKAGAAWMLLERRIPVAAVASSFGVHHSTVYAWVRAVCGSDHEMARDLRPLAFARGLWRPRSDP